jgi:hypothetical protein
MGKWNLMNMIGFIKTSLIINIKTQLKSIIVFLNTIIKDTKSIHILVIILKF